MKQSVLNNVNAMPRLLKLIAVSNIVFPLFVVASGLPNSQLTVFGQQIPTAIWWTKGGGPLVLAGGLPMCAATLLIIKRIAWGRVVYLVGWAILTISIPIVGLQFNVAWEQLGSTFISNCILGTVLGFYLYRSRGVNEYFKQRAANDAS